MTVNISPYLEVLGTIITACALWVAISDFIFKKRNSEIKGVKVDSDEKAKLEVKVQELEGMIETNYGELQARLTSLEQSIKSNRENNITFENRVLASVDKLEGKIDRLQDLVIKVVTQKSKKELD